MSCGCSNNINYPSGCGSSSCNSCSATSCEQVVYTGPNLECAGIDNNDNLCVAIQKLDDAICNVPIASITASNGLYKTGSDIRMGGALTEPTIISTSTPYPLSLTGLVTDNNPQYVLVQTNLGVIRKSLVSTITSNILALLTADNGLTYTSTNVQLGGLLIQPTAISTSVSNTLSILGLVTTSSPDYILTETNAGVVQMTATSTLTSNILSGITANNGLTKTGSTIQLGGTLIQNSTINLSAYSLTFSGSNTTISMLPGTRTPNPTTGNDRLNVDANLSVTQQTYLAKNVGIGATPFLPTDSGDVRLNVYKIGLPDTGKVTVGASSSVVELTTAGTYTGATSSYYGGISRINFTLDGTGNQVLKTGGTYTGALSYFQFGTGRDVTGGTCSAHAAQAQFQDPSLGGTPGTIDRVITYRALSPVANTIIGYNGTIGEYVGLQIEDQKAFIDGDPNAGTITDSYAIKQLGGDDVNLLNGPLILQKVYGQGSYADDAAAAAAGIPIGGIYRTANVLKIRIV